MMAVLCALTVSVRNGGGLIPGAIPPSFYESVVVVIVLIIVEIRVYVFPSVCV